MLKTGLSVIFANYIFISRKIYMLNSLWSRRSPSETVFSAIRRKIVSRRWVTSRGEQLTIDADHLTEITAEWELSIMEFRTYDIAMHLKAIGRKTRFCFAKGQFLNSSPSNTKHAISPRWRIFSSYVFESHDVFSIVGAVLIDPASSIRLWKYSLLLIEYLSWVAYT